VEEFMARRQATLEEQPAAPATPPTAAPDAPAARLMVVIEPNTVSLPWPPHYPRAATGDVLFEDDPCLDTTKLPDDVVKEFNLLRGSQLHKVAPAPEGAEVTAIREPRLAALYLRLGYSRTPYANEAPAPAKPAVPSVRTEPSSPVHADDLAVPERDRIETE
jgi:hypothetical protein